MADTVDGIKIQGNVVAVLTNVATGMKTVHVADNIVTTAGVLFFAQKAAGESPSPAHVFTTLEMGNIAGDAPAAGSNRSNAGLLAGTAKAVDGSYPQTDDGDADNTGAGTNVITRRYSYAVGEGNALGIDRAVVTNATPGVIADFPNEPLLSYALFDAEFDKTDIETLKVFVNHTLQDDGV